MLKWIHAHPINLAGFAIAIGSGSLALANSGLLSPASPNKTVAAAAAIVSCIAALFQLFRPQNAQPSTGH